MGSLPRLDVNVERLVQIPGQPPSLLEPADRLPVPSALRVRDVDLPRDPSSLARGVTPRTRDACHLDAATKDREAATLAREALAGGAVL